MLQPMGGSFLGEQSIKSSYEILFYIFNQIFFMYFLCIDLNHALVTKWKKRRNLYQGRLFKRLYFVEQAGKTLSADLCHPHPDHQSPCYLILTFDTFPIKYLLMAVFLLLLCYSSVDLHMQD